MKRRFLLSLTFILIFSLVVLVGCTKTAQEKPLKEDTYEMKNGLGNNAYNYENKANRLYGYFGSENMGNGRMNNGISNPNGSLGLDSYGLGVNPNTTPNNYGNSPYSYGTANNFGNTMKVLTGSQSNLVRKLESNCNQIKGVNDTTIVKKGNTCYVGCDLNTLGNNGDLGSIKSQCTNRIKNLDPSIKNVVFTADTNAKSKLETMIRNINIGRPARGFMTDLDNLFR